MAGQGSDNSAGETVDLCIVGAGASGLNALSVAVSYLPKGARVVLIDRRDRCGGMWNSVYDHVRLHQPHGTFTAGNFRWDRVRPRGYLARKPEVQAHLAACLDKLRERVDLVELFGHEAVSVVEESHKGGHGVRVTCRALDGARSDRVFFARRAIKAYGYDVAALAPLELDSRQVVSTTPEGVQDAAARDPAAPICIVGGGKTAMDTALALIRGYPGRRISILSGRGTLFADRRKILPPGAGRWFRGQLVFSFFGELAMLFDGDNEEEVFEHFRSRYAVSPDGQGERFLYALLSEEESAEIAAGVSGIRRDYLDSVTDGPQGPVLHLRGGARLGTQPGTIIVNCTGHVLHSGKPYEPYLSPGGAILTITPRSSVSFQTILASYFLTHLFLMGRLRDVPLYELDMEALYAIDPKLWQMTSITHTWMNIVLMVNALPVRVLTEFGADLDRWFPLHRRLAGLVRIRINRECYLAHGRAALDRVRARSGVACGPLSERRRAAE